MNRTTKASIATATGIVLLLGGAGSLAYWNSSADVGALNQSVKAGTLNVAAGAGQWDRSFWNGATPSVQVGPTVTNVALGQQLIVPGNKLTYTQTFTITAEGQDLYFTMASVNPLLGTGITNATITPVTLSALNVTTGALTGPSVNGAYHVTSTDGKAVATFTATYSVTWPFGTVPPSSTGGDNASKGATVTLGQGSITLTQVALP